MRRILHIGLYVVLAIAAGTTLFVTLRDRAAADAELASQVKAAALQAQHIAAETILYTSTRVLPGVNFSDSLRHMGIDPSTAENMTASAQPVFDLRRFHAGNMLSVGRSVTGVLRAVRYRIDADRMLYVELRSEKGSEGFDVRIQPIPSHTETIAIAGTVHDSLFNAVIESGESPELAVRMAEIFGWDLDFYSDPEGTIPSYS